MTQDPTLSQEEVKLIASVIDASDRGTTEIKPAERKRKRRLVGLAIA